MSQEIPNGYEALENYRTTLLANGFSPAELLIGRRIRTPVPIASPLLDPKISAKQLNKKEGERIQNQKYNYDRRHRVRELQELRQ